MLEFKHPQFSSQISFVSSEIHLLNTIHNLKQLEEMRFKNLITPQLAKQWSSREKIKLKLPSFYKNEQIVYPPLLNLEQCSSELTAQFKASLFSGNSFFDITGGFGIDSFFFAKKFNEGIVVERNEHLQEVVLHNYKIINVHNVKFLFGVDAASFLKNYKQQSDLIYLDPARRNDHGGKVFQLEDCEPNVVELLPNIYELSNSILIKTSPLLDISMACNSLKNVKSVYVVSVQNECKELLFHLEKNYLDSIKIHAVDLNETSNNTFSFYQNEEANLELKVDSVKQYLYEPNASVMKAGGYKSISNQFDLCSLHVNSHLYTSDKLIEKFPGRIFQLQAILKIDKQALKKIIPNMQANLSLRNFPGSTASLKKKLGIKDGGEKYIFATTLFDNSKVLLILNKV